MNRYPNEEMAWQHLQDMQREAENRRLTKGRPEPMLVTLRWLATRAWHLAGLAARRPPRYARMRHEGE